MLPSFTRYPLGCLGSHETDRCYERTERVWLNHDIPHRSKLGTDVKQPLVERVEATNSFVAHVLNINADFQQSAEFEASVRSRLTAVTRLLTVLAVVASLLFAVVAAAAGIGIYAVLAGGLTITAARGSIVIYLTRQAQLITQTSGAQVGAVVTGLGQGAEEFARTATMASANAPMVAAVSKPLVTAVFVAATGTGAAAGTHVVASELVTRTADSSLDESRDSTFRASAPKGRPVGNTSPSSGPVAVTEPPLDEDAAVADFADLPPDERSGPVGDEPKECRCRCENSWFESISTSGCDNSVCKASCSDCTSNYFVAPDGTSRLKPKCSCEFPTWIDEDGIKRAKRWCLKAEPD